MKFLIFSMIVLSYLGCSSRPVVPLTEEYTSLSFNDVWHELESDKVKIYPDKKVSFFVTNHLMLNPNI